jgi:hypothetical protein
VRRRIVKIDAVSEADYARRLAADGDGARTYADCPLPSFATLPSFRSPMPHSSLEAVGGALRCRHQVLRGGHDVAGGSVAAERVVDERLR